MLSWNANMRLYMKEHLPLYTFVSVLFIMGVVFGALIVNALSPDQKQELANLLGSFFHTIDQGGNIDSSQSFQQVFGLHLKWLILIWILGLTIIGLPIILILNFLKGVFIGFTIGYLVGQLSWKGMLFALVAVAPQNLIIIPVLIICSVTAISFSMYIVKNRFVQRRGSIAQPFISYSITTLSFMCVMLGISVFEAFVSPIVMKWVTPILLAM